MSTPNPSEGAANIPPPTTTLPQVSSLSPNLLSGQHPAITAANQNLVSTSLSSPMPLNNPNLMGGLPGGIPGNWNNAMNGGPSQFPMLGNPLQHNIIPGILGPGNPGLPIGAHIPGFPFPNVKEEPKDLLAGFREQVAVANCA